MMIFPFAADPLVTVSITILNTIGITVILLFVLMWRRAASPSDIHATTNSQAAIAGARRLWSRTPPPQSRRARPVSHRVCGVGVRRLPQLDRVLQVDEGEPGVVQSGSRMSSVHFGVPAASPTFFTLTNIRPSQG